MKLAVIAGYALGDPPPEAAAQFEPWLTQDAEIADARL